MPLHEILLHPEYLRAAPGEFEKACAAINGSCFNVMREGWHPASVFPIIAHDAFEAGILAQQEYKARGEIFQISSVSILASSTLFYVEENKGE
jgi:hypothetical protein